MIPLPALPALVGFIVKVASWIAGIFGAGNAAFWITYEHFREANDHLPQRQLSPAERWLMSPFFDLQTLNEARITEHGSRLPPGKSAITLNKLIVVDGEFDARRDGSSGGGYCSKLGTCDMALLAHELVHVEQYRELGKAAFGAKYIAEIWKGNSTQLEADARAYVEEILPGLRERNHHRKYFSSGRLISWAPDHFEVPPVASGPRGA